MKKYGNLYQARMKAKMLVRMYLSSASELTKVTGALMPLLTYFFGAEIEMTAKFAAIVIIYLLKSKIVI